MEIKSTINIVLKDLAEARDLIDDLRNYPGVPLLQVELAKAKCRSAEDVIRLLAEITDLHLNAKVGEPVISKEPMEIFEPDVPDELPVSEEIKKPQEPVVTGETQEKQEHPDPVTADMKVENSEPVRSSPEEVQKEKISNVVDAIVNLKEKERPEEKREKDKGKKIVADNFPNLTTRINEQIGDKKKESPGSTPISKPLTDLTREIGINDRFYFIREVFDGKQDQYQKVISDLNRVNNIEDAIRILKDGTGTDPSDEPAKMLLDLVKRKISSTKNE
jgi:hypothetical protein